MDVPFLTVPWGIFYSTHEFRRQTLPFNSNETLPVYKLLSENVFHVEANFLIQKCITRNSLLN